MGDDVVRTLLPELDINTNSYAGQLGIKHPAKPFKNKAP